MRGHPFVSFDDDLYVTANPHVAAGLTAQGVRWAFLESHAANWHPLTWLSHMLDVELFGMDAGAHHAVSALLFALAALALFAAVARMTSAPYPSFLVAALFALHPLRVESVAWAAERKDVLAALFWSLALLAHAAYARRPGLLRYGALVLAVLLGLLAKPTVVTLPFVLLLLDYWPLGRLRERSSRRLAVLEKLPLLLLCAAVCAAAVASQRRDEAMSGLDLIPLAARVANAPLACAAYLSQTFHPVDLACYYPHPAIVDPGFDPTGWPVVLASLLLLVITAASVALARRAPWIPVGWLWFLGVLVPVIGIVQVGTQAHADRYTLLPSIGLAIALVFGIARAPGLARSPRLLRACAALALVPLALLAWQSRRQVHVWRDGVTLYEHALAVTERNTVALVNLGEERRLQGRTQEAVDLFRRALAIDRFHFLAAANLGQALLDLGEPAEAETSLRRALRIRPHDAHADQALGIAYLRQGRSQRAMAHFLRAVTNDPSLPEPLLNLGTISLERGENDHARAYFARALALRPDLPEAHLGLARAAERLGDLALAVRHLRAALQLRPGWPAAARRLAWILATAPRDELRDGAEAHRLALAFARATSFENPRALEVLAAACAERGDLDEAVRWQERALELADEADRDTAREHLETYRSGRPLRSSAP